MLGFIIILQPLQMKAISLDKNIAILCLWSQSLHSGDQGMEPRYQGSITDTHTNREYVSTVISPFFKAII